MSAVANADQWKAWDGEEGDDWTESEAWYNESGKHVYPVLLDAAAVADGERILDLGCGAGQLTRDLACLSPAGSALGVDLSSRMLERARLRAKEAGLVNVEFLQADAQVHSFQESSFDLVVSKYGAMFFSEREAAFANIARATRRDGRLVVLAWQNLGRNEWLSEIRGALAAGRALPEPPMGMPGPFGLADSDGVREMLNKVGWETIEIRDVEAPVYLGDSVDVAYATLSTSGIARGMLSGLDENSRAAALRALKNTLSEHAQGDGVLMSSRSWLITARRR
ncbi:MAG: class I SAM-dependent methyltransferase [Actinomycetota bacterium]